MILNKNGMIFPDNNRGNVFVWPYIITENLKKNRKLQLLFLLTLTDAVIKVKFLPTIYTQIIV